MEHVNDDMDELFQRAGEQYPLKASASDWDSVMGKLSDEISGEKGIPNVAPVRNNSVRRRWLLLMLVPAFIFSLVYFTRSRVNEKNLHQAAKANTLSGTRKNPVSDKISSPSGQAAKEVPRATIPALNSMKSSTADEPTAAHSSSSDKLANGTLAQKMYSGKIDAGKIVSSGTAGKETVFHQTTLTEFNNPANQESFREPVEKPLFLSVYGLKEKPSVSGMPLPISDQKNMVLNSETVNTAKTKTNKAASSKGIYAVLMGGPDWSTVKFQSSEKAGYSLGILVGYRFNKQLSIETGLLWDKKNYYSDGNYFEKDKLNDIYAGDTLLNVDGYCKMFEIPISIRYNFAIRSNHSFFVSTGLSSYLMKKEYYSVDIIRHNGNPWSGNSSYFNSSTDLFSVLQISGGYEYAIGGNTNILIEPYLKIPLGGIGVGNMPISSMGLYFGISHLFH